jgi:threonine/homoserine/homoserine lactone efflux protein
MSWHDLLGFIVILGVAAAIPGPDVAAIVANGLGLWTAPVGPIEAGAPSTAGAHTGVMTGIAVSLSNPKALVFFSAVVPSVLPIDRLTLSDDALILAASTLVFAAVFGAWAFLAAKAREFLGNAARRRGFNRISALLIAGSAAAVAAR